MSSFNLVQIVPSLDSGGVERGTVDVANFLAKKKIKNFIITGLHVHVGVDSGEKAIAVTNGLTRYIPHLIAISASSAIHDGEVTGLASTRTKIFEALPTAGIPHRLLNFSEFQKLKKIKH